MSDTPNDINLSAAHVEQTLKQIADEWTAGAQPEAIRHSAELENDSRAAEPLKRAAVLYRLATVWRRLDQVERAQWLYAQALPLFRQADSDLALRGAGICAEHLGEMARAAGKFDEALQFYQQAADCFERAGEVRGAAIALNNAGNLLEARGAYTEAHQCFTRAVELSPNDPSILGNLALVCFDRFEIVRALVCSMAGNWQRVMDLITNWAHWQRGSAICIGWKGTVLAPARILSVRGQRVSRMATRINRLPRCSTSGTCLKHDAFVRHRDSDHLMKGNGSHLAFFLDCGAHALVEPSALIIKDDALVGDANKARACAFAIIDRVQCFIFDDVGDDAF
jgi:tetratricopeptide (TPR) repeat protein